MIYFARCLPNSPVVLLARVQDAAGNLLTQSGTTSITAVVTDLGTDTAGQPITVPVSSSVFNTLQLSDQWTADNVGFNLAVALAGSYIPTGQTTYQVVVTIVPSAGLPYTIVWRLQTDNVV